MRDTTSTPPHTRRSTRTHACNCSRNNHTYVHNVVSIFGSASGGFIVAALVRGAEAKPREAFRHDTDVTVFVDVVVPLLHVVASLKFDGVFGNVRVIRVVVVVVVQDALRILEQSLTRQRIALDISSRCSSHNQRC